MRLLYRHPKHSPPLWSDEWIQNDMANAERDIWNWRWLKNLCLQAKQSGFASWNLHRSLFISYFPTIPCSPSLTTLIILFLCTNLVLVCDMMQMNWCIVYMAYLLKMNIQGTYGAFLHGLTSPSKTHMPLRPIRNPDKSWEHVFKSERWSTWNNSLILSTTMTSTASRMFQFHKESN